MAKSGLEKYNARVKSLKRGGMSYAAARKKASAETKSAGSGKKKKKVRKVSGVARRKKSAVGTKPKYKVVHEVRQISGISYKGGSIRLAGVGDVNQQKGKLKALLGQQAGWLDVAISSAKTEREKKALRKKRREVISQLNSIK